MRQNGEKEVLEVQQCNLKNYYNKSQNYYKITFQKIKFQKRKIKKIKFQKRKIKKINFKRKRKI